MSDFMPYFLNRVPTGTQTLLDVCTGRGIVGALNQIYIGAHSTGIEVWDESAQFAARFYDTVHQRDAVTQLEQFCTVGRTFDVVTCFESIEHFSKPDALHLLGMMEKVGRLVFVSSVNWFYDQPEFDGNPYQRHRCLITSREMESRGYTVRGTGPRVVKYGGLFRVPLRHYATGWLAWKTPH